MTTENERLYLEAQRRAEEEMRQEKERRESERQEKERQAEAARKEQQDSVKREAELRKQAEDARKMASGEDRRAAEAARYGLETPSPQELAKEAQKATVQADLLHKYPDSLAVQAVTDPRLSPFINIDQGGNLSIDVVRAIKSGVSEDMIKQAGIKQVNIVKAKRDIAAGKFEYQVRAKVREFERMPKPVPVAETKIPSLKDYGIVNISAIDTVKPPPSYKKAEAAFNKAADRIWTRKDLTPDEKAELALKTPEWEQLQDAQAVYSQTLEAGIMSKDFAIIAAEVIVPGLYLARHWSDLSSTEKALFIGFEVASLIPLYGAVVKGARTGATFGRAAMLKGAYAGLSAEVKAQLVAPINMIIHPVGTVKATGKQILNLAENIAHPKKIAYTVLTTTDGTVRIRISNKTTPAQAIAARNLIMEKAATGEKLLIKAGDQTIEVATSPFMSEVRKAGGALAHTTPAGEPFDDVLTVLKKEGMSASEQGLYFANEPLERFAKSSAFGKVEATRPTIYITSQDTAKAMKGSEKIYRNTAELERILPVSAKTSGPQQRLFTRIGPNADKVQILLEKPLSAGQLAKLKALTIIEAVKAPFKPAIKFKGYGRVTGLTNDELNLLARELRRAGNIDQARSLLSAGRAVRVARQTPRSLTDITGMVRSRNLTAARRQLLADSVRRGLMTPEMARRVIKESDARRIATDEASRIRKVTETTRMRKPDDTQRQRTADETERLRAADETDRERVIDETEKERPPRAKDETERARPPRAKDEAERVRPFIPSGKSDKEARREIKTAGGAIAWRMGQVGDKDRWDVVVNPYTDDEHYYMLLGKKPAGATIVKKGKGSAYGTTQVIRGKSPDKEVQVDSGISDIIITPKGKKSVKMRVMPDPKMETKGDITIGGRNPRISDRTGRISGRTGRISPKVPKLK